MATIVDYAGGVPSAASIKAAGHIGAVRYLSPPRPGSGLAGKPITRREVEDYEKNGLALAFVWQYGKDREPDCMRGAVGGELDARAADVQLQAIGRPGAPIYFAVDFDISLDQWNSVAVHYFRAAVKVLGRERVGIYGHSRVVAWAKEDGVVADVGGGRVLGWVTNSWASKDFESYAVLFQRIVDTAKKPGPKVGGVTVDVNDILAPYWGQTSPTTPPPKRPEVPVPAPIERNPGHRGDPHFLPKVLAAFGVKVEYLPGWDKWGMGDFGAIWGVVVHHTGANNTSAQFIARNGNLGGALSSQIHLSKAGVVTMCGVGIAYHAGRGSYPGIPKDDANRVTIGIEAVSDGRQWPPEQLDAYHRVVAAILWYLGHDSSRCIAHHEWAGREQGKWDPGLGGKPMPMGPFRQAVQFYIDNPPFTADRKTLIEEDDMFTEEDRMMLRALYERETSKVRSTYVDPEGRRSDYAEDRQQYLLDDNRKIEDVHANMLPSINAQLHVVTTVLADLIKLLQGGQTNGK